MAIVHVPGPGDVLMCDFDGFKPPEMTKVRRVVVLSKRARTSIPVTYIVVPISMTYPLSIEPSHCEFPANSYCFFHPTQSVWAKADMVTCVASHRLDRMRVNGRFTRTRISAEDLQRNRESVLHALGMETWRQVEASLGH